ncbi:MULTISPECIES: hypothetical protein [unclassified Variovorax]|jgi:hypothetical protein|uniref:hypothetical protein n=1 Tax=unclassified Variovorax TaxID=663243 RepID=UPI0008BE970F|nr:MULTISPECIES: hypothetical protein [unclassified Variovorax]SEJ75783.1 hypothetical protein SAMN05518853_103427 [Variovorax sp. OK202]SFC88667.1 hypothetical protein SAMN05444746_103427 [Variovorax sp. OK212]
MPKPAEQAARLYNGLVKILSTWFVWIGWTKARETIIELIADFFVSVGLWALYKAFSLIAHHLIETPVILQLAERIHSASAIASFSLLAGFGLLRILRQFLAE